MMEDRNVELYGLGCNPKEGPGLNANDATLLRSSPGA